MVYFNLFAREFPDQMAANVALLEIYSMMKREKERNRTARRLFCQANAVGIGTILSHYDRRYNTLGKSRIQAIQKALKNSLLLEKCEENNKGGTGVEPEPPL